MRVRPRKFDVGEIICQEIVSIGAEMEMPQLHSILGQLGARLLVQTLGNLPSALAAARPQTEEGASYGRASRSSPRMLPDNFEDFSAQNHAGLCPSSMGQWDSKRNCAALPGS